MEEVKDARVQILERVEGVSYLDNPGCILDDCWRGNLSDFPTADKRWHGDRDWFVGLVSDDRYRSVFNNN